jgi:hypothetical protein
MVVAKTVPAQTELVRQLQARTVKRIYRAIADGVVPFDGTISTQIGRDPHNRLKMAVLKFGGKPPLPMCACWNALTAIPISNASWKPAAPTRFAST